MCNEFNVFTWHPATVSTLIQGLLETTVKLLDTITEVIEKVEIKITQKQNLPPASL